MIDGVRLCFSDFVIQIMLQVTSEDTVEKRLFEASLTTRLTESIDSCQYSRAG